MNAKQLKSKIRLLLGFMYFVAPMIWGIWITARLQIVTTKEFLHCITSPVSLIILPAIYFINYRLMTRKVSQILNCRNNSAGHIVRSMLRFHILSIIFFGTIGTFICMSMLRFPRLGFFLSSPHHDLFTVITGSMAGTALTFIFFTVFTYLFLFTIQDIGQALLPQENRSITKQYIVTNLFLLITGSLLLICSAVLAVNINNPGLSANDFVHAALKSGAITAIPVFCGTSLMAKMTSKIIDRLCI